MPDTLVIDANAFNIRGFGHFLRRYHGRKLLPAVAAAELYHRAARRGHPPERFLSELSAMGVTIEPLDAEKALAAAAAGDESFRTKKADWLIGAHALAPGRILVTDNIRDYPHVPRKKTPHQLMWP